MHQLFLKSLALCTSVALFACSSSESGPADKVVDEALRAELSKYWGLSGKLPDIITIDSLVVKDRKVSDGTAEILVEINYTCKKDAGLAAFRKVLGPHQCRPGEKLKHEFSRRFVKWESGWKLLEY